MKKDYTKKFLTTPSVIYACYSNVIGIPTELASEIFELFAYEKPTCYVQTLTGVPADVYEFELRDTAIDVGDIVFGNVFVTKEICEKYAKQIANFEDRAKDRAIDETEMELYITLLLNSFIDECIADGLHGEYACVNSATETGVA